MQDTSIQIPGSWGNVAAFFQNLTQVAPLLQSIGLSAGPDAAWWLPALIFHGRKDSEQALAGDDADQTQFDLLAPFTVEEGGGNTFLTVEDVLNDDWQSSTTIRDDGTSREDFTIDGELVATRYINITSDVSWSTVTNFYEDGVRVRKLSEFENGVLREDLFSSGTRTQTIQRDEDDVKNWSEINSFYNTTGHLSARDTVYDDGSQRTETFIDGQRMQVVQSDEATNAHDWFDIETNYTTAGDVTQRTTLYDNGMERVDFYASGALSVVTKVDSTQLGAFDWSHIIQFYGTDGAIVSRGTTFDDGTFKTEDFDQGARTRIVEDDHSDNFNWERIERIFDDEGTIASQERLCDNGDLFIILYDAGKRNTRIEVDGDDTEDWQVRVTEYDPITTHDTSVQTFADAAFLPAEYAGYLGIDAIV